jgi:cytoskeletal protein RodZ
MVMQPMYGNGVIDNQTIEISHDGLRTILNQIEAELVNSEVYRRTMAGLQTMLGEASSTAQILVKAVGREAVRLTFQQFIKQYNIVPVTSEKTQHTKPEEEFNSHQDINENSMPEESQTGLTIEETDQGISLVFTKPTTEPEPPKKPAKISKVSKAEFAAQTFAIERFEMLRRVGQELREARINRGLTIEDIHNQTLVPPHHIEAIEEGRFDELPEDVYIRGFIRRIAHALDLNGTAMVASIPQPDLSKSVVPSWYNSITVPSLQLNSLHLYVGYTALIAGAVGGLSMMQSQQATPGVSAASDPIPSPPTAPSPKADNAKTTEKPGVKYNGAGIRVGGDIAQPETSGF